MQEVSSNAPASLPRQQPPTVCAAVTPPPPSSSMATGMYSAKTLDSGGDGDATGPPESEEKLEGEAQRQDYDRPQEEKPEQPETPERSELPAQTAEHARADDTAAQAKLDDCTTPPAPAQASEASSDGHGTPRMEEKPKPGSASGKRDLVATKSGLLAFRSFSRNKKGKKSGDAAPVEGRVPSPGEHGPAHGKAEEEAGVVHKERRKRFWK